MSGLTENLPVLVMLMVTNGVLAALLLGLLAAAGVYAARRRQWGDPRRRRVALLGLVVGAIAGVVLAFAMFGGGPDDLGYWLDWAFLACLAAGAGFYTALLAYLMAPLSNPQAGGD